jgi:hypothetical protein
MLAALWTKGYNGWQQAGHALTEEDQQQQCRNQTHVVIVAADADAVVWVTWKANKFAPA